MKQILICEALNLVLPDWPARWKGYNDEPLSGVNSTFKFSGLFPVTS